MSGLPSGIETVTLVGNLINPDGSSADGVMVDIDERRLI